MAQAKSWLAEASEELALLENAKATNGKAFLHKDGKVSPPRQPDGEGYLRARKLIPEIEALLGRAKALV